MFTLLGIFDFQHSRKPLQINNFDVFRKSPEGRKFRSRNELRQYLEKHNLEYNAEDFDFSIWGRGNRPPAKGSSAAAAAAAAASVASTTASQPPPVASGDGTIPKAKTGTLLFPPTTLFKNYFGS